MKDVFLHIKLIEQASVDESPAMVTQEASNDEVHGSVFKLTFACNYSISWLAMSGALDSAYMCYKKIQIFEKKGFTLGVVHLLVQAGQVNLFKVRIENALKSAINRPKPTMVKLPFSLCGFQDENTRWSELGDFEDAPSEQSYKNGIDNSNMKIQVAMPLPTSSFVVSVDEWQTIQSGGEEIAKWLLNSNHLEFIDSVGPSIFKGVYKGRRVGIEKLKGCDNGNAYAFDLHRDLLALMTCGHKNILQFYGVCVDENHGLCVVTKLMEGGSVSELIMRNRKLQMKEIVRIATDFAEAIKFVNDHDVAYQDLNTQRILLDRHGIACFGDMGIVTACKLMGEAVEYATDGYRWLAPALIAGDPTSGYLMSTKDPFIDLMGRLTQNAYMVSSNAGTLLDTYEKLVEFPFMLQVFAKYPKRKTSANILFGNALSHECWQPTEFFQSQPFDPGISLTANMLIDSTLSVAFVPTITTDFFLQQILEFNLHEAHNETNLFLGTAIVDLSVKGFFVFVAMWPWGLLGSDYAGFDMGRNIEEPSLWCIVDVEVQFEETCSLLFLNIEELLDADDPYLFRLLVMAHIARGVCGKRLFNSLVLAREHQAFKILIDSVDFQSREIGDATSLIFIKADVTGWEEYGVIKKSLLMSSTGSINSATDGDLRLVQGDAIVSQCDHTLAAINVKPFDPGGHFATTEISSRVVMDVGSVTSAIRSTFYLNETLGADQFYSQRALSSSLFLPQPCGQGCLEGEGNVMNMFEPINVVSPRRVPRCNEVSRHNWSIKRELGTRIDHEDC